MMESNVSNEEQIFQNALRLAQDSKRTKSAMAKDNALLWAADQIENLKEEISRLKNGINTI